jgi:hypothetical protein
LHPSVEGPNCKDENPKFHGASGPGRDGDVVDKKSVAGARLARGEFEEEGCRGGYDEFCMTNWREYGPLGSVIQKPPWGPTFDLDPVAFAPGEGVSGSEMREECLGRLARKMRALPSALEEDAGFVFVGGAGPFAEAAFFGDAERRDIFWMDEADGAWIGEARVGPAENGADGFGGIALAVHGRRHDPAGFAEIFDGRLGFAEEMGNAYLTGECAGGFFLDDPETEAEERPVSGIALEFEPGFFLGERAPADEAGDAGIGPHFAAGGKVVEAMTTQAQVRRIEDGVFVGERKRLHEAPRKVEKEFSAGEGLA